MTFRLILLNRSPPTKIYTLSLHDALPIFSTKTSRTRSRPRHPRRIFPPQIFRPVSPSIQARASSRSEERRVGKECRSRWSEYHCKKNMDGLSTRYRTDIQNASSLQMIDHK